MTSGKICAVVITYHPDAEFSERLATIAGQADHAIVVDNGGVDPFQARLGSIRNLTILRNETNVGLGAALNQGIRKAQDAGYRDVIIFDQDSTPCAGMVEKLAQIRRTLGSGLGTAILCSNFVDERSGRLWINPDALPNRQWADAPSMTMSGSLMSMDVFEILGPFREDLFVDLVDLEYTLRARSMGYHVAVSVTPMMRHRVGSKQRRRLLWRSVWPSFHSAERRFLMARNTIQLIREYGARNPRWALRELQALAKATMLVLLFENEKSAKLAATSRGLLAGLR